MAKKMTEKPEKINVSFTYDEDPDNNPRLVFIKQINKKKFW